MAVTRAYHVTDKEARRHAIEAAADRLFARSDELPSVQQIVAEAGLAKGTFYLYFGTKEEVFAALLREGWSKVMDLVEHSFYDRTPPADPIGSLIDGFARLLEDNPNLMRLDAVANAGIEGKLPPDILLAHKSALHQRIQSAGDTLERALDLRPGRGFELLTRTHALARGLWQSFGVQRREACVEIAPPFRFDVQLREALIEYWRGAMA